MKKKSIWENLKNKTVRDSREIGEIRDSREKIRQQFLEISRLGGSPIVMQMGN